MREFGYDRMTETKIKQILTDKGNETIIAEYIQSVVRQRNLSADHIRVTKFVLRRLSCDLRTVTEDDIGNFLNKLRKPESEDPLHKWIGTYNIYHAILKKFFKWFGAPHAMEGFKALKRKEQSIYKPSDIWTVEDDLLFLKYCPSVRDRCYHAISRDSSCRPSEIMRIRLKDVVFKMAGDKQYAEILVNGKTGSRHIPLINSIPYLKDWLDVNPSRNNGNTHLIRSHKTGDKMTSKSINGIYARYKVYFQNLLESNIPTEDKEAISNLLQKPWNPYIRRHSALTEKSKILREHILRYHAGWRMSSKMPEKYLHYFGNESNKSILEAYGLEPKSEEINKMQPVQCPNCGEGNKIDSKFCAKCRMILSYDAYTETIEEKQQKESEIKGLQNKYDRMESKFDQILSMIQQNPKLAGVKKEDLSNF